MYNQLGSLEANSDVDSLERTFSPNVDLLKSPIISLKRYREAYFIVFLVASIVCWSPFNALGYLAPWLALIIYFVLIPNPWFVWRLSLIVIVWALLITVHWATTKNFVVHSAILSLLTYGSFIFFLCIRSSLALFKYPLKRMESAVQVIILVESTLGIIQALYGVTKTGTFDGSNGDYVEGTIHPWLQPELAFSNPIFAVNLTLLLLFLLPSVLTYRKAVPIFVLGMLALILASVMHVILFLIIATGMALMLYQPSLVFRKQSFLSLLFVGLIVVFSFLFLRGNLATVNGFIQLTLDRQTPRTEVMYRVFNELPSEYPLMPFIGLGPGQFSSRAGLIGTGMFFGTPYNPKPIPLLPQGMSLPFEQHVLDLWLRVEFNNTGNNTSSTFKPFFSWLSLYSEFGSIGILVFIAVGGRILGSVKFRYHNNEQTLSAISVGISVIFILLLGAQENYWEVSQAMFSGLLLINARYESLCAAHHFCSRQDASI